MEFHNISLADKGLFYGMLKDNPMSSYNFTTNYIWGANGRIKVSNSFDALFILCNFEDTQYMLFPVCDEKSLPAAIEAAVKYMKSIGITPKFCALSENDVLLTKKYFGDEFIFDYDRDNSDYIYDTNSLITLSGKKYHSKKNHLNSFKRNYSYIFRQMTKDDIPFCKELFDLWYDEKTHNERFLDLSKTATYTLLQNIDNLNVNASVLEVEGKIIACTVGEAVTEDTSLIHVEFANTNYVGSYAAINNEFVKNVFPNYKYTNREEDMGNIGLRKAKTSYHPVVLLNEYTATYTK